MVNTKHYGKIAAIAILCLELISNYAHSQPSIVTGSLFLISEQTGEVIPAPGYKIYLYDTKEGVWTAPGITDFKGRFSIQSVPDRQYVLRVYHTRQLESDLWRWRQMVWQQYILGGKDTGSIVLPALEKINVEIKLQQSGGDGKLANIRLTMDDAHASKLNSLAYYYEGKRDAQTNISNMTSADYLLPAREGACPTSMIIRMTYADRYSWVEVDYCAIFRDKFTPMGW